MESGITNISYWEAKSILQPADYCIIGAGIVGINAALEIQRLQPKANILILDRGSFPLGASTRNAGFACFGSASELLDDLSNDTEEAVFELVEMRYEGLQALHQVLAGFDFGFQACGNFEVFRPEDQSSFQECHDALPALNRKMARITGQAETFQIRDQQITDFGFSGIDHLILNQSEGTINTGQLMRHLIDLAQAKGIRMLWGIEIQQLEHHPTKVEIHTKNGWTLECQQLLLATNAFTLPLLADLQLQPARNQVLVSQEIPNLKPIGAFHLDKGYVYFRNIGHRLLIGGGRNIDPDTETTAEFGSTTIIRQNLLDIVQKYLLPDQHFEIAYQWSGILGVGQTKRPIIQSINDRMTVAVRMGGMGVAIGTLVGQKAAKLALQL
ncbi:MAG: FAD-dependent oxidoreductase [Bacteroidota bacterium]